MAPGSTGSGLHSARLLVLRVSRAADVLWAMEEALRCPALACVVAELSGEGAEADLTATRRLSLAARDGVSGRIPASVCWSAIAPPPMPSAAATRWQIAAAPSLPDPYGGLGRTRFDLSLRKNRRGPSASGSSSGTIMSVLSGRRYLSVWLSRLSTDRIERRLPRRLMGRASSSPRSTGAAHRRAERRRGAAAARKPAWRLPTRAPCIRRCRWWRPISRPTAACSKRSPTGATATRRWSGSIRRTGLSSTSPAARICSAARRRWRAIWWRGSAHQGFAARAAVADTVGCAWARRALSGEDRRMRS